MRCFAVVTLLAFASGCAHFTAPPETPMVEIASAPAPPPPPLEPSPSQETHGAKPKRRALLVTGLAVALVGVALTVGGAVSYVRGRREQEAEDARCRNSAEFLCGLGSSFDTLPGVALLGVGVPHLGAGLVLMLVGAGHHD